MPGTNAQSLLPLAPATFHILLSLAAGDKHGYAIIQDVTTRTNNQLKLGAGTLYRSLQRMLEEGLILETGDRPTPELDDERRRYYRLTVFGACVARAETQRLAELVRLARVSGFAPELV
jgi:DNA-binding PadR family transcriptional regulator